MAWPMDKIQDTLLSWNKLNYESLPEGYIMAQINWHKRQPDIKPPPNCKHESYYLGLNVCNPDRWCTSIKNPLQNVKRQLKALQKPKRRSVKKGEVEIK